MSHPPFRFVRCLALLLAAVAWLPFAAAEAQTDYYNTDAGRPITIEDAYSIERRAVEIQVAPLRLERSKGGRYAWGVEPELALGLLPRTQVELGLPFAWMDHGAGRAQRGLAGIHVSVLHNLNVETSIPALAFAADLLIPAGPLAPDRAYPSVKAIATRTFPWARFHVNARYTFGDEPAAGDAHGDLSRWLGGLAIDKTFPLESLLLTAEVVAREPLGDGAMRWDAATGTRYQLTPRVATDAGVGYRLTGDDQGWFFTMGAAVAIGLPWTPRR